VKAFEVQAIGGRLGGARELFDDEQRALGYARSVDLRSCEQVTITGRSMQPGTFAVRHLSWQQSDGDGCRDTGWRAWVDGRFVGAVDTWPIPKPATSGLRVGS